MSACIKKRYCWSCTITAPCRWNRKRTFRSFTRIRVEVGTERIDLLVRLPEQTLLVEIKAHTAGIRDHVEIPQLKKYVKSLRHLHITPTMSCIVNFPQKPPFVMEYYFL